MLRLKPYFNKVNYSIPHHVSVVLRTRMYKLCAHYCNEFERKRIELKIRNAFSPVCNRV